MSPCMFITNDSQFQKKEGVLNLKCLGLYVTKQYYSLLKSKYSPSI